MERYVWRRRQDGVHILDLGKTWDKLVLAARVIAGIEHAADICVISGRTYGQRAVHKFANFTGATAFDEAYKPGYDATAGEQWTLEGTEESSGFTQPATEECALMPRPPPMLPPS